MTQEMGRQSWMKMAADGEMGGQMNTVRWLVKRKQRRDGRLIENCVYRQHKQTKLILGGRMKTLGKVTFLLFRLVKNVHNATLTQNL